MTKANQRIRNELKNNGFFLWQLSDLLGISESTLYVKIRRELPEEEQNRIIDLIRNAGKERS